MENYKVAGYIRLSKEDRIKDESNSVTNQKLIIASYIKKNEDLDIIKQEATPVFRKVVELNNNDKTLLYGKIQATYVFPTEKHKFDLKLFIEEQKDFYIDNISYFDPYSEITQVSDYVKFTVKKK